MAREKTESGELLNDTWETPAEFMEALQRFVAFPLELDVCAGASNTKCEYYIDRETNALGSIPWSQLLTNAGANLSHFRRIAFCNPGYSSVLPWCERALWEANTHRWSTYVLAHDNFCGPWFRHAAKYARRIYLLYPRIQFLPPPGVKKSTNSRCSILLNYAPTYGVRIEPHIVYTNWNRW